MTIEALVCGLLLRAADEAAERDPLALSPLLNARRTLRAYVAVLRLGRSVEPHTGRSMAQRAADGLTSWRSWTFDSKGGRS